MWGAMVSEETTEEEGDGGAGISYSYKIVLWKIIKIFKRKKSPSVMENCI